MPFSLPAPALAKEVRCLGYSGAAITLGANTRHAIHRLPHTDLERTCWAIWTAHSTLDQFGLDLPGERAGPNRPGASGGPGEAGGPAGPAAPAGQAASAGPAGPPGPDWPAKAKFALYNANSAGVCVI